jgi:Na+/proline symporter
VAKRYNSESVRFWLSVAIFLGVIGYLGTQVQAMGVVMQAIFGGPLLLGSFIGLAIMAIYSAIGGMVAGVYTDLFQGILMVLAAVVVFFSALRAGGGVLEINQTLHAENPDLTSPFGMMPLITIFCWFVLFSLGAAGQPHFLTKFLMVKNEKELKWGAFTSSFAYMLSTLIAIGIGLAALSLSIKGEFPKISSPDQTLTTFLLEYASPVVAGLVMAGLMAAIMSTGSSFVNLGAACIVRDIPKALGIQVKNELFWSRMVTLLLFVLSFLFAVYMDTLVALLGVFGWGTFATTIFPAVVLGLLWEGATAAGAVSSIVVGLVLSFVLEVGGKYGLKVLPPGVINGAFTFAVSIAVFIAVSMLTQQRQAELDHEVRKIVNEA